MVPKRPFFIFFLFIFFLDTTNAIEEKFGRCPTALQCEEANSTASSECFEDHECHGALKCCPDGCPNSKACRQPVFSACEHGRRLAEKRTRALMREDPRAWLEGDMAPSCRKDGAFEPVQCGRRGECWCVDGAGYEMGGTRGPPGSTPNCTAPRACAGPTCRMLCPYDFEMDEAGCPLCRCRDPCAGVRCPGNLRCQLEEVECEHEPCPPVPDCKSPRALNSVCPIGQPLNSGAGGKAFVCGEGPESPKCPPYFACTVGPEREYGVCCPSLGGLAKPGTCPNITEPTGPTCEGAICNHDTDCEGLHKCCFLEACGSSARCVPMAEDTKCLQQKMLAQLLSSKEEHFSPGYVPQCAANGEFEKRQCSRNGLVCWCVDDRGDALPRTVGDSGTVTCPSTSTDVIQPRGDHHAAPTCGSVVCTEDCAFGYVDGPDGCPTCLCKDPCEDLECPEDTECSRALDPSCSSEEYCEPTLICRANAVQLGPKPGTCPKAVSPTCGNGTCRSDADCEGNLKCCSTPRCPNRCVEPEGTADSRPAMCEYLRGFSGFKGPKGLRSAFPDVSCESDGRFNATQCERTSGTCWCVDEFGAQIGDAGSYKELDCDKVLSGRTQDELLCRLDCDYGLKTNTLGQSSCECRDPCLNALCSKGTRCQMVPVDCHGGSCPPVPLCVGTPVPRNETLGCLVGGPLQDALTGMEVDCVTWASSGPGSCPLTHFCSMKPGEDTGVCCPQSGDEEERVKLGSCPERAGGPRPACSRDMRWDECQKDSECPLDSKCCPNDCGVLSCHRPIDAKQGQCPLVIGWEKLNTSSCDPSCNSDADCEDTGKCCYNGCSLSCMKPLLKTGCQMQLDAAARLPGASWTPKCNYNGDFEPVQCENSNCWCVDPAGRRIPGTPPNCTAESAKCPERKCNVTCGAGWSGYQLDAHGCPTCECRDLCVGVNCPNGGRLECRNLHVNCVNGPCPPVPTCAPTAKDPCEFGVPLMNEKTGKALTCAEGCPSTHRCQLGVLGDFAACCPKSGEVCDLSGDPGTCSGRDTRWRFDQWANSCVNFTFGGCGGNENNFNSRENCDRVCPPRSKCEKLRHAALRRTGASRFLPKCKADGSWEALQCLPEVGICWCSTPTGSYVEGSAVRGVPKCSQSSSRTARKLTRERLTLCPKDQQVHACPQTLCDGKVCLAQPDSSCRVDPCDGCSFKFYSSDTQVDCDRGLTPCQLLVQRTLNSDSWHRGAYSSALTQLAPPKCTTEGAFEAVQSQSPWSWCVDPNGKETPGSLTNGTANCDGTFPTYECPNGNKNPRACTVECLDAYCGAHPEALCVADPCDGCRVSFVSPKTGQPVRCEDECLQPVEAGNCNDAESSWYFDADDGSCKAFLYSGCYGNDNRFRSREDCVQRCENPADVCSLPKRTGVCRGAMKRWYFDKMTRSCRTFVFGGCDGNGNNFETKEECDARCPDTVLCNRIEFGKDPKVCVRSAVCADQSCAVDPYAVCTADPCTGQYFFVDTDGQSMSCETPEDPTTQSPLPEAPCVKLSKNRNSTVCDDEGHFAPTQCDKGTGTCWCVDEAGRRVPGVGPFAVGEHECEKETVKSVAVRLSFGHECRDTADRLKALVRNSIPDLLNKIRVPLDSIEDEVTVEVSARAVDVKFTLAGHGTLDTALSLEDKILAGEEVTLVLEGGSVLRLDRSASTVFEYGDEGTNTTVETTGWSSNVVVAVAVVAGAAGVLALLLVFLVWVRRCRSSVYFPRAESETSAVMPSPEPPRDKVGLYLSLGDRWQSKA